MEEDKAEGQESPKISKTMWMKHRPVFPSPSNISNGKNKDQLFTRIIKIILIETKFTKQRLTSFIYILFHSFLLSLKSTQMNDIIFKYNVM